MKTKGVLIIILTILLAQACKNGVDPEAEKAAIIDVINAETQAYLDFDYEKVVSLFVQDSLNIRLTTGTDNYVYHEGWNEVAEFYSGLKDDVEKTGVDSNIHVEKDNFRIKLFDDAAYVIFTEKWSYTTPSGDQVDIESRQLRFMQKVGGEWKIALLSFVGTSGYEDAVDADMD